MAALPLSFYAVVVLFVAHPQNVPALADVAAWFPEAVVADPIINEYDESYYYRRNEDRPRSYPTSSVHTRVEVALRPRFSDPERRIIDVRFSEGAVILLSHGEEIALAMIRQRPIFESNEPSIAIFRVPEPDEWTVSFNGRGRGVVPPLSASFRVSARSATSKARRPSPTSVPRARSWGSRQP